MANFRVFDDRGNLLNRKPVNVAIQRLRRVVRDLYTTLLARGMTPVEGRALCDVLAANVSMVAAEQLTARATDAQIAGANQRHPTMYDLEHEVLAEHTKETASEDRD